MMGVLFLQHHGWLLCFHFLNDSPIGLVYLWISTRTLRFVFAIILHVCRSYPLSVKKEIWLHLNFLNIKHFPQIFIINVEGIILLNNDRTKEQLGYTVESGKRMTYRVLGFCFLVQSSDYSPNYLHERINHFIDSLQDLLVMNLFFISSFVTFSS